MADTPKRSREEMELELHRLTQMFRLLPPEKQKTHRASMQRRIDELSAALNGKSGKSKKPMGTTSGILLGLIGAIVALAGGFFIIMLIAKSHGS